MITASASRPLSPAQTEFNKRMKSLEKARAEHQREEARLDRDLRVCIAELMPLLENVKRAERDLVHRAAGARKTTKLTPKRHRWLGDLISGKAADLLVDPVGLTDEDLGRLEALVDELGTSFLDEERKEIEREEFGEIQEVLEELARQAGVKLDLSGLDIGGDPAEFERQIQERLAAAGEDFQRIANGEAPPPKKRQRKPSRAALERERRAREIEEAKTRDFKSLYKQLAKVLHPDLETDPVLKEHKEAWMKRLTAAHANRDLRDLLAIEMEWLGEEAGNLATAGDEKLRIYAMVLKEQAEETRERTRILRFEPRYQTLERFMGPFGGPLKTAAIRAHLEDEIVRLGEMIECLSAGGADARGMICAWADAHARACQRM